MESHRRLRDLGLLSLAVLLGATGCTVQAAGEEEALTSTPSSTQPPRQTAAPAPSTPTPTPTPLPIDSVPPCDEMLTTEQVRAAADDDARVNALASTAWSAEALPGPLARDAHEGARTTTSCGWGIPQSDGIVHLEVALLEAQVQRDLQTALEASSEYSHDTSAGIELFSREVTDGLGSVLAYALSDGVWVIIDGTLVDETTAADLARDAMGRILAR